jgi:hypothetical protein
LEGDDLDDIGERSGDRGNVAGLAPKIEEDVARA